MEGLKKFFKPLNDYPDFLVTIFATGLSIIFLEATFPESVNSPILKFVGIILYSSASICIWVLITKAKQRLKQWINIAEAIKKSEIYKSMSVGFDWDKYFQALKDDQLKDIIEKAEKTLELRQ